MSTIEQAREQARETLADYHRVNAGGYGAGNHTYVARALRALLDATEPPMREKEDVWEETNKRLLDLHGPVEIEPSETICGQCSFQLPNGAYFGKVEEWPCPTVRVLQSGAEARR